MSFIWTKKYCWYPKFFCKLTPFFYLNLFLTHIFWGSTFFLDPRIFIVRPKKFSVPHLFFDQNCLGLPQIFLAKISFGPYFSFTQKIVVAKIIFGPLKGIRLSGMIELVRGVRVYSLASKLPIYQTRLIPIVLKPMRMVFSQKNILSPNKFLKKIFQSKKFCSKEFRVQKLLSPIKISGQRKSPNNFGTKKSESKKLFGLKNPESKNC